MLGDKGDDLVNRDEGPIKHDFPGAVWLVFYKANEGWCAA